MCILRCLEACLVTPVSYPCTMVRISFSANYFKIVDQSLTMNTPFVRRTLGVGNLYTLPKGEKDRFFANIARVRRKTGNVEKRLALFTLLLDLMQEINDLFEPDIEDTRLPQAREVLDFVNEHYCEDIGIHDLTQRLYMSRSQIERIMKTSTGYSTWNYILQKRITRATQLLHSGMGNREVAQKTGFRDYSTFYKAFVKLTHQTPTGEHPTLGNDPLLKNFYLLDKDGHSRAEHGREKLQKEG
ncbi:MAG: helix-turn-helix transcriptional regulator [Oscillospiraceae bacterium]|nr:helix-turn-helix transcriptional regulator [Oscillospiraceae bacterium]